MNWVWDILALALFAFMIFRAWKDGFFKTLMNLLSWILALILAVALATPVATWIFDTFIRNGMTASIAEEIGKATSLTSFLQGMEETLAAFPETIRNFLNLDTVMGGLNLSASAEELAVSLVDSVIAPLAILLISLVCITVLFLVLTFALSILVNLLSKVFKLPVLRQVDRSLGLVLGLIQGVIAACVFSFIVHALCSANLIDGVLSVSVYESTYIVRTVADWLSFLSVQGIPLSELAGFAGLFKAIP